MKFCILSIMSLLFLNGCATKPLANSTISQMASTKVTKEELFDESRQRKIPVAYYTNHKNTTDNDQKVIILSHGYGQNKGGDYLVYSYLTQSLANAGYFVVSIQHELPSDELLAMEGNFLETRMPNWRRGMENIHFVLTALQTKYPSLDYNRVTLIGHSNGGDMSVLFAHQYPKMIEKVISLDNRRMPLPRVNQPKIYTLRSNDYPADLGVLPSEEESAKYGMTIQFTDINHGSMDDGATQAERIVLVDYIQKYLKE